MDLNYFSEINVEIVGFNIQIKELSNSGYYLKSLTFGEFISEYLPEANKPSDVYNALESELKNQGNYQMSFVGDKDNKMGAMADDLLKSAFFIKIIVNSMQLIKEKYIDV